jgi:D-3-phosphoglycerate dehydrogenase / 2-oxoglutarate reductase
MLHKVLISDALSEHGLARLQACPHLKVDMRPGLKGEDLLKAIPAYHALIIRSGTKVTSEVIDAAVNLRVIGRAGIGADNVDLDAATRRGILVMNTPGGNTISAAEHTLAFMLALARHVPQANASLKSGQWRRENFTGTEICNKVLGVIGLGNIGSIVAERARGLKMHVLAYDPFVSLATATRLRVELVSLDTLYARADFLTVHMPLTEETRGLIDAVAFAKMKKGVRIINCARGGIVDEHALHDAILNGIVAGAALDVFVKEPPPATHPLLQLDQVICTPHLGAATDEAQVNVAIAIADQVVNFLTQGVTQNAVNLPVTRPQGLTNLKGFVVASRSSRESSQAVGAESE